jgi:surface antigen
MSSTKLVALFGLVAMLGTGGVVATANATSGNAPAFAATTNVSTAVSSVSFNLSGSSSGSAVSRSATRSDTSSSSSSSSAADASQTGGQWDLEGSADSINTKKVSVASVANTAVQKKLESGVTPPSDFDANHATGDSGNAYSFSQCTWWAYKRRKQLGLPVGSHLGNGAQWAASAKALGYWVDNNPQVGDVMVFATGQEGASSAYGHVAIVEKIEDGKVITSESGASLNGDTMSRTFENVHDFEYIHF